MKKTIFKSVATITLILAILTFSVNAKSENEGASERTHLEIMEELGLVDVYGDDYGKYIENSYRQANLGQNIENQIKRYYKNSYPTYYSGIYVSDDALNLIIQVVKKNIPKKNSEEYLFYNMIINMDNVIKVEYVNHSLNELIEINEKINKYFFTSDEETYYFLSANGIDTMNNRVVVEFPVNNIEQQEYFKKHVINSELIMFGQGVYEGAGDLRPGGGLNTGPNGPCSMGFRTRVGGRNGYMTAGHCTTLNSTINTGIVRERRFANNQNYDYAWVETNSSWNPTNRLMHTATGITTLAVVTYSPPIVANMAIAKSGNNTGYTTGRIHSQLYWNVTYLNFNNWVIRNLIRTTANVNAGDSGGPFFTPRMDTSGGPIPIGITGARGGPNDSFFTSINNLPAHLHFGRY